MEKGLFGFQSKLSSFTIYLFLRLIKKSSSTSCVIGNDQCYRGFKSMRLTPPADGQELGRRRKHLEDCSELRKTGMMF